MIFTRDNHVQEIDRLRSRKLLKKVLNNQVITIKDYYEDYENYSISEIASTSSHAILIDDEGEL